VQRFDTEREASVSVYEKADRAVMTHRPSQMLVEPSGADKVHIGRDKGNTTVVLDALYILPVGAPFSEEAADPGCA
jgi:hypothetical protein